MKKEEDIREVQRLLLKKDYSIKSVKDIGDWMKKNLVTSKEYVNKPEFKDFLKQLDDGCETHIPLNIEK